MSSTARQKDESFPVDNHYGDNNAKDTSRFFTFAKLATGTAVTAIGVIAIITQENFPNFFLKTLPHQNWYTILGVLALVLGACVIGAIHLSKTGEEVNSRQEL